MAEEIKKVLSIQFDGKETIGDVKKEVAELKKELDACAVGSSEAAKKSQELAQAQEKLKAAMRGAIDENGKLTETYNGLVSKMAKLKAAQKEIDISTRAGRKEYKAYAKEIKNINDELKDLDAKNGVFARNVGNYADSMKQAFSSMGGAVGGVFTSISNGLKMLVTNPWVAALTAILAAVNELIKAFKRNSDAMLGVNKVFNKFRAIIVLIQQGFDTLVKKITEGSGKIKKVFSTVFDGIAKALDATVKVGIKTIGWVKGLFGRDNTDEMLKNWEDFKNGVSKTAGDITDKLNQITVAEDNLQKQHTKNILEIAQNNKKIAELNAIVADRENYTVEERQKALEESAKLQKRNLQLEINEAKERLRIMKLRHSLTQSSDEDLQEEAELQAEIIAKQAQMADVERNTANQRKAILKDLAKESKESLEATKKYIEQELSTTEKGTDKHLELTKERLAIEKQLAILDAKEKIKDETKLQEALAKIDETYAQKEIQAEKDHQNDLVAIRTQELQNDADILSKGSQEYFDAVVKLKKYVLDNITKLDGETDAAFQARLNKATEEYQKAVEAAEQNTRNSENKRADNKASQAKLDNGSQSLQYYQAELDAARTYYDNLQQLQDESNEDFEARQIAALQKVKDAEENLNNQRLNNFTSVANGIANIMSTVASAWEDSIQRQVEAGEISEEEGEKQFENVKALQIATATIQTITGAITAFMSAQQLGFPWGTIIGAIQAAAVTAAGIAEIAKIKSTTLGGGGSGVSAGGTSFQLPAVERYQPEYTQNLTGVNDTADLSNSVREAIESADIRAIVVESDITSAQAKRQKRNSEATW